MKKIFQKSIVACSALLLGLGVASCGGGGGDGDGTSSSGLRIMHAALDASPADITSSSKPEGVLQTAYFAQPTGYKGLSEGDQLVSLFPTQSSVSPIFRESLSYQSGQAYSLLLFGNNENLGLQTKLLQDARPIDIEEGRAALRIVHALDGASAVDSIAGIDTVTTALPFGDASTYKNVSATNLQIQVRRTADGKLVYSGNRVFGNKEVVTIVVTGKVDYFVTAPVYPG